MENTKKKISKQSRVVRKACYRCGSTGSYLRQKSTAFLRASAMLKHVIDIGQTSVRPSVRPSVCPSVVRLSVCLSVTRWYCIKTAEYVVMLSSPHDSPFILVLCISRSSRNSDGVTHCWGAKYRWGIKFALYLANNTRYRHGCYGRQIGTHTRSIKWCHFQ